MKVGIVYREGREKIVKTISKKYDVVPFKLPRDLPEVLEESVEFPGEFKDCKVVISYAFHGNVNEDLVRLSRFWNVEKIVLVGNYRHLKSPKVLVDSACCTLKIIEGFGIPKFRLKVEGNIVVEADVLSSAPCGASYEVAREIVGLDVDRALERAGLVAQFHCLSNRDGIHKAGRIHSLAVKRALND